MLSGFLAIVGRCVAVHAAVHSLFLLNLKNIKYYNYYYCNNHSKSVKKWRGMF